MGISLTKIPPRIPGGRPGLVTLATLAMRLVLGPVVPVAGLSSPVITSDVFVEDRGDTVGPSDAVFSTSPAIPGVISGPARALDQAEGARAWERLVPSGEVLPGWLLLPTAMTPEHIAAGVGARRHSRGMLVTTVWDGPPDAGEGHAAPGDRVVGFGDDPGGDHPRPVNERSPAGRLALVTVLQTISPPRGPRCLAGEGRRSRAEVRSVPS